MMFNYCHSTVSSGMGSMSSNLTHLPYPGGILEQPAKLLDIFEIIKSKSYECGKLAMDKAAK